MEENKKKPIEDSNGKYTKIKKSSKIILISLCCLLGVATITTGVICGVTLSNQSSQSGKEELEKKIAALTKQVKEQEAQITKLNEQVTKDEQLLKEKEAALKEAQAQITTKTEEIEKLTKEVETAKVEVEKAKSELAQAKVDLEKAKADLEKALEDLQTEKDKVCVIFMQGNYELPDLYGYKITPGKSFKEEGLELPKNSEAYYQWSNAYFDREAFDENTIVNGPTILEETNSIKITLTGVPETVFTDQSFEVTATWTGKGVKDDEFEMYVYDYAESYEEKSVEYEIIGNKCKISTLKSGYDVEVGYRHKEIEEIRKSETFTIQELKTANIDISKFSHDTVKLNKVDPTTITNESTESSKFTITYTNTGDTISEFDLRAYDKNDEELFTFEVFEAIGDGKEHTVEFALDYEWTYITPDTNTIYIKKYEPAKAIIDCRVNHPNITINSFTKEINELDGTITINYTNSSETDITLDMNFYKPNGSYYRYNPFPVTFKAGTHDTEAEEIIFYEFYDISSGDTICLVNPMQVDIDDVDPGDDFPEVTGWTSTVTNISDDRKTIHCSFDHEYSGEGKKVHLVANKYVGEDPAIQVYDFGMISFDQGISEFNLIFDGWNNITSGDAIRIEVGS